MEEDDSPPFFERQKSFSNLCGVHAINNLLGYQACTQNEMDTICKSLSTDFINPHKHVFGGDYDANVLIVSLQNIGYECKWLDARHLEEVVLEASVSNERRVGYILNRKQKPSGLKKLFGLSERHWMAIKCWKDKYYFFDSQCE